MLCLVFPHVVLCQYKAFPLLACVDYGLKHAKILWRRKKRRSVRHNTSMYVYVEINPTEYIGIYLQVIIDQMQPEFSFNGRRFMQSSETFLCTLELSQNLWFRSVCIISLILWCYICFLHMLMQIHFCFVKLVGDGWWCILITQGINTLFYSCEEGDRQVHREPCKNRVWQWKS